MKTRIKKLMSKTLLVGPVLGAILGVGILTACTDNGITEGRDSNGVTTSQEISGREGGSESGGERSGSGEHGGSGGESGRESGGESGNESGASGSGSESGSGESGSEGGESGPDGPEGPESGSEAAREAAMSSPITPLDQTWNGVLGGLAISAQYDAVTQSVNATVQNTTSQTLCYVQAEPHLKLGTQTVGELGPQKLGDLNPGQTVMSSLSVADESSLAGVAYDGYVVHMEVFDCGGPGPVAHTGAEGAESSGGEGAGGEGHGPGGEGGSESGGESGSEEGSGAMLAKDEIFDATRSGARLVMGYDAASNSFNGIVENTTGSTLSNVRIEVHLSNGTELGPTTPMDMAPGEMYAISMPATQESFTGWIAHAEVGGGEGGGEHGSGGSGSGEGSESGGRESGGEHGGSRESGGEHGGRGERRGGG